MNDAMQNSRTCACAMAGMPVSNCPMHGPQARRIAELEARVKELEAELSSVRADVGEWARRVRTPGGSIPDSLRLMDILEKHKLI